MRICIKQDGFDIHIFDDSAFIPNVDGPTSYDRIYWQEKDRLYSPSSKHAIEVYHGERKLSSAILLGFVGGTMVSKDSFINNGNDLIIRCSDMVYSLSLPSLELNWMVQADSATCFSIEKYQNSFITYGELSIRRFDFDGNKLWGFGGGDIFVSSDGTPPFVMHEHFIELTDFNGSKYMINYEGEEIGYVESDYHERPDIQVKLRPQKPWWKFW